ncbi:hypothetical protein G7062_08005 [Erysipelothrix sp. HDW6C]|uniref:hypothetical protein n=1 Tax=Erysipelothrix sp. HDW6C TaxID=2714930 RepID=UPI0014072C27|nr:hypothetical protein [Erysipelothrix sp. HDW6C]QIK70237.1 hypothetical protein G7062_08005 [Erysipelothrix sp. HDW6C]
MQMFLEKLQKSSNNRYENGNIFISPNNMYLIIDEMKYQKKAMNLLITPYLIEKGGNMTYELHYYEFDIEILAGSKRIKAYNIKNGLPKDITENLVPGIEIDMKEYSLACEYLKSYLDSMSSFSFSDERKPLSMMGDAELYYQIF